MPASTWLAIDAAVASSMARSHLVGVDRLAAAALPVHLGQRRRPREAAGVGDQDPRLAGEHGVSLTYRSWHERRASGHPGRPRAGGPHRRRGVLRRPGAVVGVPRRRSTSRAAREPDGWPVRRHGPGPRHRPPARRGVHGALAPARLRPGAAGQRADAGRRAGGGRAQPLLRRGGRAAHHPRRRDGRGPPARAALVPERGEHAALPAGPGPRVQRSSAGAGRRRRRGPALLPRVQQPAERQPLPPPRLRGDRRAPAARRPQPHPDVARSRWADRVIGPRRRTPTMVRSWLRSRGKRWRTSPSWLGSS